jgi:hypothetical protein
MQSTDGDYSLRFAWKPTRLITGELVWLGWVWRRDDGVYRHKGSFVNDHYG